MPINQHLLRGAARLAAWEGLADPIAFQDGHGEVIPLAANSAAPVGRSNMAPIGQANQADRPALSLVETQQTGSSRRRAQPGW
jgi:hypothetical protein